MPQYTLHELQESNPNVYNTYDTLITDEVFKELDQLPKPGPIYNFELALQAPVMEMTLRGIRVDIHARDTEAQKLRQNLTIIESILKRFVAAVWDKPWRLNVKNEPTFPNSTTQLIDFFYNTMGLPRITHKVKGEIKTPMDRPVLERLQNQYFQSRPIISLILAHRDITGILEVLESQIDDDQRIRCSFNIAAATTGRFSSSKSTTGTGQNLQNISENQRKIFIADRGYKIAAIDKSQAESREFGYFCGITFNDWSYLDAIESGDIHTYTCRLIWPKLDWTGDLKKDKSIANQTFYRHLTYRDMTKRASHGSNYYGKSYTISQEIKVPQKFVQVFQEAYFDALPVIPRLHQWVAQEIQTKGFLVNIFGRRRDFFSRRDSDETLRAAIAYLFQSATADDLNLGLWRLWKYMPNRVQLLLQLHDAVYFQYKKSKDEKDLIQTAQKYLDVKFTAPNGRIFIVPTEPLVGFNFGHRFKLDSDGKKLEVNPKGLDEVKW